MIEDSLASFISGSAAVAEYIGGSVNRIFPLMVPQRARDEAPNVPYIVYSRISATEGETYCGPDGLIRATYQLDMYSPGYRVTRNLSKAVKTLLKNYTGEIVSGDESVLIDKIMLENEIDLFDSDPGLFRRSQTYTIWYIEE